MDQLDQQGLNKEEKQEHQPNRWSAEAHAKAGIVNGLVGLKPIPSDKLAAACWAAARLLGKSKPVPPQTIYNWRDAYERDGISGLERKRRNSADQSTLPPLLVRFIRDQILDQQKPNLMEIWCLAKDYARSELNIEKPEELPTYDQVLYIDRQIPKGERKLAQQGMKLFRDTHELVERFEADYANQFWQVDHHLLDIIVVDPKTKKHLGRPWLTIVLDDYSRAIAGLQLALEHPSSMTIARSLRHAMLPKLETHWAVQGVPEQLYVDNGKDFKSNHIETVCLHFKIMLNAHEPYLARAKGKVERFFRTLEDMCISKLPGYVGSNPKKRPVRVTPEITLDQLFAKITSFIVDEYHERVHGTTKMRPRLRWLENLRHIQPLDQTNERNLDFFLLSQERKVHHNGIRNNNYYYADAGGIVESLIGQTVTIFFDLHDQDKIFIYERKPHGLVYACTALRRGTQSVYVNRREVSAPARERRKARNQTVQSSKQRARKDREKLQQDTPKAPTNSKSREPKQPPQRPPTPQRPAISQPVPKTKPTTLRFRYQLQEHDNDDG